MSKYQERRKKQKDVAIPIEATRLQDMLNARNVPLKIKSLFVMGGQNGNRRVHLKFIGKCRLYKDRNTGSVVSVGKYMELSYDTARGQVVNDLPLTRFFISSSALYDKVDKDGNQVEASEENLRVYDSIRGLLTEEFFVYLTTCDYLRNFAKSFKFKVDWTKLYSESYWKARYVGFIGNNYTPYEMMQNYIRQLKNGLYTYSCLDYCLNDKDFLNEVKTIENDKSAENPYTIEELKNSML